MIFVFLFLLVLSLVSLGFFARRHNQIRGDASSGSCILYATVSDDTLRLSSGVTSCAYVIWGEGLIGAVALGLILLAVVKVCIKMKV